MGTSFGSGRLEIFLLSELRWGTVCDDLFDLFEGDIACRQLGFQQAVREGNVMELGYVEFPTPIITVIAHDGMHSY